MAADTAVPDWHYPRERCAHCTEAPTANRTREHLATAHADLPDCTARIETAHGTYTCAFKAGHKDCEYGEWHASSGGPLGRYVWNDGATGDTAARNSAVRGTPAPGEPNLVAAYREAMPRLLEAHSQPSAFHTREMERARERARRWEGLVN